MGESRRAGVVDREPALHEVGGRAIASIRGPADQALELERVDRSAEDREGPEKQVGIGSEPSRPGRDDRIDVSPVALGPREQVEPERRAAGPLPERRRLRRSHPGPAGHQPHTVVAVERPDVQGDDGRLVADDGRQRCCETVGDGRGPGRDHERETPPRAGRCPDQEVAQGERERVDPLEVVDEQGRGALPGELSMDGLEDPDGVEPADLGPRVEQAMERPILAGRREPAEQRGRRGQRHARLRLVTGEPVDPLAVERPPGFIQEPRLPDPGVPHEEERAHAPFAPRRSDQRADGRHLVRPTDEHLAHAVRLRRPAIAPKVALLAWTSGAEASSTIVTFWRAIGDDAQREDRPRTPEVWPKLAELFAAGGDPKWCLVHAVTVGISSLLTRSCGSSQDLRVGCSLLAGFAKSGLPRARVVCAAGRRACSYFRSRDDELSADWRCCCSHADTSDRPAGLLASVCAVRATMAGWQTS